MYLCWLTTFEQNGAGRGYLRLKYAIILKVWLALFVTVPSVSRNNAAMRLLVYGIVRCRFKVELLLGSRWEIVCC